eukprot:TCALIF_10711-PA protein Name:"Protein of unknown function" AED:0.12 eAED:0.14 QI:0/0/0/0.33/1/1/3/0/293
MSFSKRNKLRWVQSQDGHVPPGAIAGGREKNNPYTFIGRFTMRDKAYIGRVVPTHGTCYVICKAMEHKRSCYQVLVNPSSDVLVWRKDYLGHVPDTAIQFSTHQSSSFADSNFDFLSSNDVKEPPPPPIIEPAVRAFGGTKCEPISSVEPYYIGRARVSKNVVIPGYIVPCHGMIHSGYDNREIVKDDYEVLCHNQPCSLKYLAAKKIRDIVRKRDRLYNAKYSTRISNALFNIEKIFLSMLRKRLDFNTIMANCCPPEENCCCQMWVELDGGEASMTETGNSTLETDQIAKR